MERIAIVSAACLFPEAADLDTYWANLMAGRDCRRTGDESDFGIDLTPFLADRPKPNKIYCLTGGFIRDFDFDATGYRLPADQLQQLDEVFQWPLHTAHQALVAAGYGDRRDFERTGIILGNYTFPTRSSNRLALPLWHAEIEAEVRAKLAPDAADFTASSVRASGHAANLKVGGLPPWLIASALGLSGPQFAVDAACSSAIYAIDLACAYLRTGRADMMLAGSVCAPDPWLIHLSFSELTAYPTNGSSSPFDRNSQGIHTGQGAGMVVLKRLSDARAAGDPVLAVIEGIGLSNDGAGKHLLSPNPAGQLLAYERAYAEAGLPADRVDYVECHATGTPLGDRTELESLSNFFDATGHRPMIGSVKANLGHLLTVAGLSSLIKVVRSMQEGVIPPTIGIDALRHNERTMFGENEVVRAPTLWPDRGEIRYGGVSAFGFGGTNAHMVMSHDPSGNDQCAGAAPDRPDAPKCEAVGGLDIVGMAAHFGAAADLAEFETAIFETRSLLREPPAGRFGDFGVAETTEPGKRIRGAFIDSIAIDTLTYRMPPAELRHFNPQQALMLRVADAALIDAGLARPKKNEPPRPVAVILVMELDVITHLRRARAEVNLLVDAILEQCGCSLPEADYQQLCMGAGEALHSDVQPNEVLSYIGNICASRISSLWNFSGPAFTLSSDGLGVAQAIEVAELLLGAGKAEAVLIGAVDIAAGVEHALIGGVAATALNSDMPPVMGGGDRGRRLGEGAGAVLLKPARKTLAYVGDRAYARLVGYEVSKSRAVQGLTSVADSAVIVECIERLLKRHDIPLNSIGLFELGAADGDGNTAELTAAADRLSGRVALGQLESQIGHAGIAAPIAALIKTALAIHHRYRPGIVGWREPSEATKRLAWNSLVSAFPESRPWLRTQHPRRALVSMTGEAGSCAQLLVEEIPAAPVMAKTERVDAAVKLFIVDGPTLVDIDRGLKDLQQQIDSGVALAEIQRVSLMRWRERPSSGTRRLTAALVAKDAGQLGREIQNMRRGIAKAYAEDKPYRSPLGSYFTPLPAGSKGKIAFVFPGGFNAYPLLGQKLFRRFPQLLAGLEREIDDVDAAMSGVYLYPESLSAQTPISLMRAEAAMLADIGAMIVTSTSFALMLSRLLKDDFGLKPAGAFGYSLGEASMLFDAGVWPTESRRIELLRNNTWFKTVIGGPRLLIRRHWNLPSETPDDDVWTSVAVLGDVSVLRRTVADDPHVFITHINTQEEAILAGRPAAVKAVLKRLGMQSFKAPIGHVLHCEPLRRELPMVRELNRYPANPVDGMKLISAAEYRTIDNFDATALTNAVAEVMCNQVDFPRLVETAYADDFRIFIELGPAATCTRWIEETLGRRPHVAVSFSQRGSDDEKALVAALAKLASHGVRFDVDELLVGRAETVDARRLFNLQLGGKPIRAAVSASCQNFVGTPQKVADEPAENLDDAEEPSILEWLGVPLHFSGEASSLLNERDDQVSLKSELSTWLAALPVGSPLTSVLKAFATNELQRFDDIQGCYLATCQQLARLAPQTTDCGDGPATSLALVPEVGHRLLKPANVVFDEGELLAFAQGKVTDIFGADFAVVDTYPVRVRLPAPPYFFVSRVTRLDAKTGVYEPASLTTEYDVPEDAWYLVEGVMPPGIAVEAGQSDLLLIAYQGIDFLNAGERAYRLLDGKLHFKGALPRGGQTLRFDIHIRRHVRQGDAMIFFFDYEGYVDGELALVLRGGCAGFFTQEELAGGAGVSAKGLEVSPEVLAKPLLRHHLRALDRGALLSLVRGDIAGVFGDAYSPSGTSVRLPPERLLMVDRITDLGSRREDGTVRMTGEKDLAPDAWYFTSHFVDDPVMPGSLVAEGATQMLKVHLMATGMYQCMADPEFQPIPDLDMIIKVRGQVVPSMKLLRYEVAIIETGLLPRPFIRANVVVYHGEKPLILVENLGLCLKEKPADVVYPRYGEADYFSGRRNARGEHALINELHLAHAAKGSLEVAMGKEFGIYGELRAPHIPNGDFQFVDRAVHLTGTRGILENGSEMITEYDSPVDAWYYRDNAHPSMPNCVYLESALQASILLGYFLGCTLRYPNKEFSIRNLEGWAVHHADLDLRGRTIRHHETLRSTTSMGSAILQSFDFAVSCDGQPVYQGHSSFGYFAPQALEHQVGLDGGKEVALWCETQGMAFETMLGVDLAAEDCAAFKAPADRPCWRLSGNRLKLLHLAWLAEGGQHGLGYVAGYRRIDPADWYFRCHFHRDPVMPGSLGIEAIIQAAQLYALRTDLGARFRSPRFAVATGIKTQWKYRGQILMDDPHMWIELHVKEIRDEDDRVLLIADASLFKNRLRIYELIDLAIAIREDGTQ